MTLPKKGQRNKQHKLTDEEAHDIINLYESTRWLRKGHPQKWTVRKLAESYGVSRQTICDLVNGIIYEWIHKEREYSELT